MFMQQVDEIRTWVIDHMGQMPSKRTGDVTERTLANRYARFKMRCTRDLRTSQGRIYARKFVPSEKAYFDCLKQGVQRSSLGPLEIAFIQEGML